VVTLNRIYTRTGDAGTTRLATGEAVSKAGARIAANGEVDETNACVGLARVALPVDHALDPVLARIQNELFDLGADISVPPAEDEAPGSALRIVDSQIARLEAEIDSLNAGLPALQSFILPGGTPGAAALHLARTVCRRAERAVVTLIEGGGAVNPAALRYLNRLSDLLFVAARHANDQGASEVFWKSGATR
jgi:cob(I)alamin adenosyltransferase